MCRLLIASCGVGKLSRCIFQYSRGSLVQMRDTPAFVKTKSPPNARLILCQGITLRLCPGLLGAINLASSGWATTCGHALRGSLPTNSSKSPCSSCASCRRFTPSVAGSTLLNAPEPSRTASGATKSLRRDSFGSGRKILWKTPSCAFLQDRVSPRNCQISVKMGRQAAGRSSHLHDCAAKWRV
jgi:hypothetical protein